MSWSLRARVVVLVLLAGPAELMAGTVVGKLELPPPPTRPPAVTKGFLERVENQLAPARTVTVTPYMIVTLDGAEKPVAPGQITWDLVGESFARPVLGVAAGAELKIKNSSKTARSLVAAEDPKLIPSGPINPTGEKSFRVNDPKIYTIGDADAPYLTGKLVVVNTPFVSSVDDAGRFEFSDVPEGSYQVKVFYKDAWLDVATPVQVGPKGKTEVNPKVPAFDAGKK